MELLNETSATGLRRMVWAHTQTVPDVGVRVDDYLNLPLKTIKSADGRSLVELTDGQRTARVVLVHEGPKLVVQNVEIEAGNGPGQKMEFLSALRDNLAERSLAFSVEAPINIPSGTDVEAADPGRIMQIGGETEWRSMEAPRGGTTPDAIRRPSPPR
ncbi:MAG: hypothetical protein U0992_17415 [Planctomycetaceae bacterium]